MTTENIVNLAAFKGTKAQDSRIRQFKDYLRLLDNGELVTEAKGFMSDIKKDGLQEDCAHKGQAIIGELISRVKEGRFQASKKLEELQKELGTCVQ